MTGLVIGGVGQGETLAERAHFMQMVKRIAGGRVPLLVQGVDPLPEVRECEGVVWHGMTYIAWHGIVTAWCDIILCDTV